MGKGKLLDKHIKTVREKSQETQNTYKVFCKVNFSSGYVIFIWWKVHYAKKQYVAEAETTFNQRLSNYRNDVKSPPLKTILSCKNFHQISALIRMQNSVL